MSNALTKLRSLLAKNSLSAYIIPTADAHQSEYVAECDNRRAFLSGFDGSAGTAVVLAEEALLWTDGRYFLQAEKQLDTSVWKLMKQGMPETPTIPKFLAALPSGASVGFNPFLLSLNQLKSYEDALVATGVNLVAVDEDLVDLVWEDKPAMPKGKMLSLSASSTGKSVADKLSFLRAKMAEERCDAMFLGALDQIAWVLNMRGSDIVFNPVFFSYFLLTAKEAVLFIDKDKLPASAELDQITIKPYEDVISILSGVSAQSVWVDGSTVNVAVTRALGEKITRTDETPVTLAKACKTKAETNGMREAHKRDAAAMVRFLAWVDSQNFPVSGNSTYTEFTIAEKLESFRREQADFVSLSFGTISGIGGNGAIIHYSADEKTASQINGGKVFLLDSGAQYLDGTTDITRTMWIKAEGTAPTAEQIRNYTLVLMGHIHLAMVPFPKGTMGPALDAFARQFLWMHGLNFLHGTGHGVGHFLNVHEGPQGIAMMNRGGSMCRTPLELGMIISNEPGYYKSNEYGIRIESLVEVVEKDVEGNSMYALDTITLVPIDRTLIDKNIMYPAHVEWINKYHQQCREVVLPLLGDDAQAKQWLIKNTEAL